MLKDRFVKKILKKKNLRYEDNFPKILEHMKSPFPHCPKSEKNVIAGNLQKCLQNSDGRLIDYVEIIDHRKSII